MISVIGSDVTSARWKSSSNDSDSAFVGAGVAEEADLDRRVVGRDALDRGLGGLDPVLDGLVGVLGRLGNLVGQEGGPAVLGDRVWTRRTG